MLAMENLTDIAVFVRVVESSSFTAAADKLGLARSVVSKRVTRLEERLGVRLLNRTTRRLSLTEAGAALFEQSWPALARIEDAELEVTRLQTEPRGNLKVSAPMTFGILHLAPLLPEFLERYPGVQMDLRLDDRFVDLVAEGFDLAIRIAMLADSTLVARRLAPSRMAVCASPEYWRRHGVPQTPEDLRAHNCISYIYTRTPDVWEFSTQAGDTITVPIRGNLRLNNGLVERTAAVDGVGVAIMPTFYVGEDLQAGRLQPVLTDYPLPELSISAVYPQRKHLSPKVRAFIDFLSETFRPEPYWDRFLGGKEQVG
jgi:DNA-binding transcriptional LysR family regulator